MSDDPPHGPPVGLVNLLRNHIQDYLTQHPNSGWIDLKARLLEECAFAPAFIEKYGVDIFAREFGKPQRCSTGSRQDLGGPSPPSSTDNDASRQTIDQDNGGSSEHEDPDSDPGPRMDDDNTSLQIFTIFRHPSNGQTTRGGMSANYCQNRSNFIHSETVRGRRLSEFVDQTTNTLLLDWRAEPESEQYLGGNRRTHRTRFRVVNSDSMDVDLALSRDMESWDDWEVDVAPISDAATRRTPLEPQPQDDRFLATVAKLNVFAAKSCEEMCHSPVRQRAITEVGDDYDPGPVYKRRRR